MSKVYPNYYIVTFEISSELAFEELQEKLSRNPKDVNFEMLVLLTKEDHYDAAEHFDPIIPSLIKHGKTILKGDKPGGVKMKSISD